MCIFDLIILLKRALAEEGVHRFRPLNIFAIHFPNGNLGCQQFVAGSPWTGEDDLFVETRFGRCRSPMSGHIVSATPFGHVILPTTDNRITYYPIIDDIFALRLIVAGAG